MFLIQLFDVTAFCNVYIVIYATADGRTGHAGIAIDNYQIHILGEKEDTVADGTLTYFDLWPKDDDFPFLHFAQNSEARYFRLPNHTWPGAVTVQSLYDVGVPHREFYPCDALLMVRTRPWADAWLLARLDSISQTGRPFNPRSYNCSDFVVQALRTILPGLRNAREFIPFSFCTTPNKLCRKLMKRKDVVIIKDPGKKTKGSFMAERVLKRKKHQPPTKA